MDKKSVISLLKRYYHSLRKNGVPLEGMILFGSYARGDFHKDSDIDVCLLSPVFGKDAFRDRKMIAERCSKPDSRIELFPVNPQKFLKDRLSPLLHEIRKDAVRIAATPSK